MKMNKNDEVYEAYDLDDGEDEKDQHGDYRSNT